jgi:ABC-2 type transport system ATP-binding protein
MTHALEVREVTKRYVGHLAVDRLSLAVPAGTIYGILGPNGAGKSTTLRMVMNIIAVDSGTISVLGMDPARDRAVLRRVGYLPEERGLYKKMTALDVIVFFGELRGMRESAAREQGTRWLERMGLGEWKNAKVETLSKGMQQKVQFITTAIHSPELLILDEPASGLDPVNQEVLRDTILGASKEGRTVVFSTHNMDQAEQLCDYVCIIAHGRKVLDGSLEEIRRRHAGHKYRVEFDTVTPGVLSVMEGQDPVLRRATRSGDAWEMDLPDPADIRRALTGLAAADVHIAKFEHVRPSLHEIFVDHVGQAKVAERRPETTHA